jgi:hypothetical protein
MVTDTSAVSIVPPMLAGVDKRTKLPPIKDKFYEGGDLRNMEINEEEKFSGREPTGARIL